MGKETPRIVVLISMTLPESTMTTESDVRITSSANIFNDGDFPIFSAEGFPGQSLGVFECLSEGNSADSLIDSIEYAIDVTCRKGTPREIFLLLGNSTWQSDNSLVRHRGIMGMLKNRGVDFGVPPIAMATIEEKGHGLKFFVVIKLRKDSIKLLSNVMKAGSCAYLLALRSDDNWLPSLDEGFSGDWKNDSALISAVTRHGGVVMRRIGFFDDPEIGLQGVADTHIIEQISGAR